MIQSNDNYSVSQLWSKFDNVMLMRFKHWLSSLSIRQKITYGYSLAIGIALLGTSTGLLIGEHYRQKAVAELNQANKENKLLSELKIRAMDSQMHTYKLITTLAKPQKFDRKKYAIEYYELLDYVEKTNRLYNNLRSDVAQGKIFRSSPQESANLDKLLQTYDVTIAAYIKQLEKLLSQIPPPTLQPPDISEAHKTLEDFNRSEIAINFDDLAQRLNQPISVTYEQESNATQVLKHAENLRIIIISWSMLLSIGIAAVLAVYTSQAIARPIEATTEFARLVTQETDFQLQVRVTSKDEVGQLTDSLNQMLQRIAKYTQELEKSQRQNQALLNAIPDLMLRIDKDGIYLDYNSPKTLHNFYTNPDVIGLNIYDVLPRELAQQRMHYIKKALATGELQIFEYQFSVNDNICEQEARIVVSGKDEVLVIIRDITKRKQAEIALQEKARELEVTLQELQHMQAQLVQSEKMSSLGQLVAGLAHEINNPVTFIYGNIQHTEDYLQSLLNLLKLYQQHYPQPSPTIQAEIEDIDLEFLASDLPKIINSIRTGAERIRSLVLSLRNFARLDEGEIKKVNLHEGIDNTLLIFSNYIDQGISITKQYGDLPQIECYPAQLNQVFMNLLHNAIDALFAAFNQKNKQIVIITEILKTSEIRVRIQDNGDGIPQKIQNKIFDPFFTTKPVGQGTGLGLAICYQIIKKHRGKITMCSQEGKGCEFAITLPMSQKKILTHES
ncbi:MAG: ATP-binding protein [Nostocaceae cyanobacterium]|nr:ATP-binding protein [Nostocaceae cyanobacterium]